MNLTHNAMTAVENNTIRYDAHQLYNFSTGGVTVETVERDLRYFFDKT